MPHAPREAGSVSPRGQPTPKVQTDGTQDTDSDSITLFAGERFLQASITKIPLHSVTEIQITREWAGNTITIKSRILGETVVRFLNRKTSRRMYQAISNRLNNPTL